MSEWWYEILVAYQTREVLIRKLWSGLFVAGKLVFQLSNYDASAVFFSDTSSAQAVTVSIYRCQRPVAFQLFNNGNDDIVPGLTSRSTWPMFMPKSAWWWKWLMPWTTRLTAAVALICFGVSYTLVQYSTQSIIIRDVCNQSLKAATVTCSD